MLRLYLSLKILFPEVFASIVTRSELFLNVCSREPCPCFICYDLHSLLRFYYSRVPLFWAKVIYGRCFFWDGLSFCYIPLRKDFNSFKLWSYPAGSEKCCNWNMKEKCVFLAEILVETRIHCRDSGLSFLVWWRALLQKQLLKVAVQFFTWLLPL